MRRIALVVLLLGCGSGKVADVKPALAPKVLPKAKPEARVFFEEGLRLLREGPESLEAAGEQFSKAVKADKQLFEGWHDLGVVMARLGRWEAAVEALGRALRLQPASRRTLVALGEALGRLGRWQEAQKLFGERLAVDPKDEDLRLRYVQALRDGGKPTEALENVRAMLAKDSKNAAAFNALGLVYYRMERLALAESAFRRAVELEPKAKTSAVVWNNIGLVALAKGRDQEAFEAFEKARSARPSRSTATTPMPTWRWAWPCAGRSASTKRAPPTSGRSPAAPTTRPRSTISACSTWTSSRTR
jgi:Flp pilus assembly protein TadD